MEQYIVNCVTPNLLSEILSVHYSYETAIKFLNKHIDSTYKPREGFFKVNLLCDTVYEVKKIGYLSNTVHCNLEIKKVPASPDEI